MIPERNLAQGYADQTERINDRRQDELDASEQAEEDAQDRMVTRLHRYIDHDGLPGFCRVCRVNRKHHR